jgi:outer membrane protein assembly factor BamB
MNIQLKILKPVCNLPTAICQLLFALCLLPTVLFSCKDEIVDFQTNECKNQPAFFKGIGFDPNRTAYSTSENRKMGLHLIQFNATGDTSNGGKKLYQHPSWKMAGWLGPILIDPQGNCFVGPVPVINLLDNPPAKQNTIYKVDGNTGEMKMFMELPSAEIISSTNPYGILGFTYLCESNTLYVSTVHGSTRDKELGFIYAIDAATGKIIDKISNVDALGMGISYITGKRILYFGSSRSSNIYSIALSKDGKFYNHPSLEFSISDIGPRGDDKARRIKFDKASGNMQVFAIEFNYNLTAPTEKQENIYAFAWNSSIQKWEYNK